MQAASIVAACAGIVHAESSGVRAQMKASHREFLATHCGRCHDADEASGGVRLDDIPLEIADVAAAERWQRVLNVLNSGEMPPDDEPQPAKADKQSFLEALSQQMVVARKSLGDSGGKITMRRLNRREYVNTLRDLLDVAVDVRDLPADNDTGRIDTVGAGLFFSSDQFEHYLRLARVALDEAIVKGEKPPLKIERNEPEILATAEKKRLRDHYEAGVAKYQEWKKSGKPPQDFGYQDEQDAGVVPTQARLNLPRIAAYLADPATETGVIMKETGFVRHNITVIPQNVPPGIYKVRFRIGDASDDRSKAKFVHYGLCGGGLPAGEMKLLGCRRVTGTVEDPQVIEVEIPIPRAGSRSIGLTERRHNTADAAWYGHKPEYDRSLWLDWVEWEGPIIEQWPPRSHELVFGGIDVTANPGDAEARAVIEQFAKRAFRGRPVRKEFVDKLMEQYAERRSMKEPFIEAIKTPLSLVLASPNFLYMSERPMTAGDDEPAAARQPLQDVELANRLSYFLWSGPPDERLLALAAEKKLTDPKVLAGEVERMLGDAKVSRFIDGFVYQWLHMVRLDFFQFPFNKFPEFDHAVKAAAGREVYETFRDVLANGRPLGGMLKADSVMVNDLLADYYGIPGVDGIEFRRVPVPAGLPRGGLLGMAAVHAMGSDGERTSPVERGAWVLRKLLHDPPPPAPPNVPMLSRFEETLMPVRELMAAHQEEPQCAACHRKIDPIGYGLEHFDAAGRWRDEEMVELRKRNQFIKKQAFPIDSRGTMPDGVPFDGFEGLRDAVATHEPDFARGLVEHLIEYGLGRPVSFSDEEVIARILHDTAPMHYTPRAVIQALVASREFRSK